MSQHPFILDITDKMLNGFLRTAAAVPVVKLADCMANAREIVSLAKRASDDGARLIVFPEMSTTGYTCGDLFHSSALIEASDEAIGHIAAETAMLPSMIIVGAPVAADDGMMYNCGIAIAGGCILGAVPKSYLPNYNEFYEKRWWRSGAGVETTAIIAGQSVDVCVETLFEVDGVKVGVELCEDLWTAIPPSSYHALAGAEVIANLSASDDIIGKYSYLLGLIKQQSARTLGAYVYAGAGAGESSTDLVFDGKAIIAENGLVLACNDRWAAQPQCSVADVDIEALRRDRIHIGSFGDCAASRRDKKYNVVHSELRAVDDDGRLLRRVDPHPFVPADSADVDSRCTEIVNIQVSGLAQRLRATRCRSLVVGISGGLDSTLALLVAARTFDSLAIDRKGITAVTMPGFGTTGRTYNNAIALMRSLGVTIREINIGPAVRRHFADIGHDESVCDVTYENSQARERTQILMDIANQTGGMVLGTGDLSELALGWATYNGDHMSMYGVNSGIPKTLVSYLVGWFADRADDEERRRSLVDIIGTPISPELIPADSNGDIAQKTEDLVGPYELHDFFLYYTLRYGFSPKRIYFLARHAFADAYADEVIKHWLQVFFRRFFNQQFKRSCLPDGPKVGSVCLSPRGDWRMPSDASSAAWLTEIEKL